MKNVIITLCVFAAEMALFFACVKFGKRNIAV